LVTVPDLKWEIAAVADFNGDNKADILWYNSATGEVYVWLMNGGSRSSAFTLNTVPDLNWQIAAVGDLNGDSDRFIGWHRPVLQQVRNRVALHIFHDDVRLIIVFEDVVDGGHMRMVQLSCHPGFVHEAAARIRGLHERLGQAFERNASAQARIFGEVHLSHSSGPLLLQNSEMRNLLIWHVPMVS
jgi:hypothetical protein